MRRCPDDADRRQLVLELRGIVDRIEFSGVVEFKLLFVVRRLVFVVLVDGIVVEFVLRVILWIVVWVELRFFEWWWLFLELAGGDVPDAAVDRTLLDATVRWLTAAA